MPFGIVGRTGPGMRQVVGFGDWSTGRGTFGANLGRVIVNRDLLGVRVLQRRDAALLSNYFGQICYYTLSSTKNSRSSLSVAVSGVGDSSWPRLLRIQ